MRGKTEGIMNNVKRTRGERRGKCIQLYICDAIYGNECVLNKSE